MTYTDEKGKKCSDQRLRVNNVYLLAHGKIVYIYFFLKDHKGCGTQIAIIGRSKLNSNKASVTAW